MEVPVLVAVRGNPTPDASLQQFRGIVGPLAEVHPLALPPLKVGTLDSLLQIGDSIGKIDHLAEQVVHRLEKQLYELQKNEDVPLVKGNPAPQALLQFQWDDGKYLSSRMSIPQIVEAVSTEVTKIDEDMKQRVAEFSATKSALTALNRRFSGSLAVRSLADMVAPEDCIESEKLTTLFVVVPKFLARDWKVKYESLAPFVVPRSSRCVVEDEEAGLWSVTLFKHVVDEFKQKAHELRFMVREFTFDPAALQNTKEEKRKLDAQFQKQWSDFLRWARTSFAEVFLAWLHIKVVRCHVEAVLRYGLPVNYKAIVIVPARKEARHALEVLERAYAAIEPSSRPAAGAAAAAAAPGGPAGGDKNMGAALALAGSDPYFPFIWLPVPMFGRMLENDH